MPGTLPHWLVLPAVPLTLMYNCRRRTKVVPVRRRCCLPSCHSLIPAYPTHPDRIYLLPSTTTHSTCSAFLLLPLGSPSVSVCQLPPACVKARISFCLPCPSSFNQVASHSPSQVSASLPIQKRPTDSPSSHTMHLNPEVRNRNLLYTMFKFKKDAPLQQFIHNITKVQKNNYSLAEILTILKDVISQEKMFDERNPSVIICSNQLETALNQRALHVTEVRNIVINQLERLEAQCQQDSRHSSQRINSSQPRGNLQTAPPILVHTGITSATQTNKGSKFQLRPLFLEVVRTVPGVNPKQTVFTYEEITSILSKYILSRKKTLFDKRNIKLALVENDPLGKAFNVAAFHRCQVHSLLRTQLMPAHPNSPPDQLSTTSNKARYSRVAILL